MQSAEPYQKALGGDWSFTRQIFMWYVYVLESKKDSRLYTGCTGDLKKRVREHNSGRVFATEDRQPLVLVYYEAFLNRSDAFAREQWLKTGWGRTHLQKILANYLKN